MGVQMSDPKNEAASCLETLRMLDSRDSVEWIEEVVAKGKLYLELVKRSSSCNTVLISTLRHELMKAQFLLDRKRG